MIYSRLVAALAVAAALFLTLGSVHAAGAGSNLEQSCRACERYLEEAKGISRSELEKLGNELESVDEDDDMLLDYNVEGCQAMSPDLMHVCEQHVSLHGWTGLDMLLEENGQQLCSDIDDCVESFLGVSQDMSESDSDQNDRSGDDDSVDNSNNEYSSLSQSGLDRNERREQRRKRRARIASQSRSQLVRDHDDMSDRMTKLMGKLDESDRAALEEVMIASQKGFFNPHAHAQAIAAQQARAREAEAAAAQQRAAAERAKAEAQMLQQKNQAMEAAQRAREQQMRDDQARDRQIAAQQTREKRMLQNALNQRQDREDQRVAELKRRIAQRDRMIAAMKNARGPLMRQLANGALKPHDRADIEDLKARLAKKNKKRCKKNKKNKKKKKKKSKKRKGGKHMSEKDLQKLQEFGTMMNAISAMNSPLLTVGANNDVSRMLDEFDDRPVVDDRDSAKVEGAKQAPPASAIEEMGNESPEQLAMMPMIMMSNPNDPKTLAMAISGF